MSSKILEEMKKNVTDASERAGRIAASKYEELDIVLKKLEETRELPKQLKEKLEKIGTNPVVEPKIYKLIQDKVSMSKLALAVVKEEVLTNGENDAQSIAIFVRSIENRITSFRDDDGKLKSTELLNEMELPNILQVEELQEAFKSAVGYEDISKEEQKKENNRIMNTIKKCMGLKGVKLSDWEDQLLMQHAQEVMQNVMWATPVGKL